MIFLKKKYIYSNKIIMNLINKKEISKKHQIRHDKDELNSETWDI